ncbi:discoidin domain-containing protein [Actinoplanes sp. NPDC026619]|uniref:discoidin domain-containing protein n=1 Tax=Actinoplanes sp. NPDC026619 TaxID=3155798 RepID=UPI0033CF506D
MPHPRLALALTTVMTAAVLTPTAPAFAAQTIGYPTFSGPALPAMPAAMTTGNTMQAMYDAEKSGTDFWMDRLLSRSGNDPAGTWLMSRGRAVFMKTHTPSVLGFGGAVAYWESINDQAAFTVTAGSGTWTEQVASRWQAPSHWKSVHTNGSLRINQTKFITQNDVAVDNLTITNTGSSSQTVALRVTSPYATTVSGSELTGQVAVKNGLTTIFPRLSGDSFAAASGALTRSVTLAAGATTTVKIQLGFVASEIPESLSEYNAYKALTPDNAFAAQVRTYNQWWADNVPYLDVPEPAIKKEIYYRWWLMRFNYLDANIPGQDFQFPTSVEGALGYNNAIALTQPMHIDDLKYLRNPAYSYGPWLSVGQVSKGGRFMDNPGDPENWSNSYTQYIAEAAWKSFEIHGGQPAIAGNLAKYAEGDVKGQLSYYDHNNDGLIEYDWGALTGNDADAVSFDWKSGNMDRAESAYVYSGAVAAAQAYAAIGNTAKAAEMQATADRIKNAIVTYLWDSTNKLIEHRHIASNSLVPWKEINNYYPYAVGAMPNTDEYKQALRLFADPAEYPIFPFYTANQKDKALAAAAGFPGSNNFSTINSTVQFRLYSSVLRNYPNQWMTAEDYKKLLYWNSWAQYIGGNTAWPDANEFWADWNAGTSTIDYRSWIHHNILGSSNWTVIEDVMGLRPRTDKQIELSPISIGWPNFAANNLRYRNADLSIVWDDPADGVVKYAGIPQGYSIFVNGTRVATVDKLVPLTYNPDTGAVTLPAGGSVTYSQAYAGLQAPTQVVQGSAQMVDMFNKAGVDLTADLPNYALNAATTASYTTSGTAGANAVDGFPINEPLWGTYGSPNATDWLELNLGQQRTVNEVRVWFRNDRATNHYRQPSSYQVQYLNGSTWTTVATAAGQANYNVAQFPAVSATRLRVQVTHASGVKTGITEVKVANRGGVVTNANKAPSATPTASYTSSWESVAALNDAIDPPSSNDTVNRRWGTWPDTGEQWGLLTWPAAQSLSSADVYFFDDNGGVRLPASWKLQYWNGTAYVDVAGASGYPTALNQYNHVTFTPVSTTRLRVLLQSGTASVGLLEVKAF